MLFFSKNTFFSALIFIVSFFIPVVGFMGLIATIIAISSAELLGFDKLQINSGIYSYSALLFGLGFSTNYEFGNAFMVLLIIGAILTMLLSIAISSKLASKNIPGLSLAFIFTTWIVILAAKNFAGLGLTQRHIYWVNETYAIGGQQLVHLIQSIENWQVAPYISGYFRSLSAIIFQGNIAAGILLSIGLLINSRISFVLTIIGYSIAIVFNQSMGGFNNGDLSYYNIGTNFMLVAIALGGFYLIPSMQSFFWNIVTIPIAYMMVVGLGTITYSFGLPVFSLPFCIVVILFLYCLQLRKNPKKLVTTPIQYYSPEINLYNFLNGKERLLNKFYLPFSLPVMGKWMVSQGHNGNMTHQGDWSNAIDLVILDDEMKTFQLPGNKPEHFYCYNKPVISPADGIVEEIIDYVPDNEIGNNNTNQNWGNSIIIKHAIGLYSKISHLKLNSIKVSTGSFVKKGDVIAMCGNSGRSPEPHVHFQIQSTPYIGSKTINYPIAYFYSTNAKTTEINNYAIPKEGSFVSNITPNVQLQYAFNFQPGLTIDVSTDNQTSQKWETGTDMYNESYIYCKEENAYAYFISNGTVFYFTNYIGPKKSLLYYFYLSAYKVLLSSENKVVVKDTYPLNIFRFNLLRWIQDIVAPFFIFIKIKYESESVKEDGFLSSGKLSLSSKRIQHIGWSKKIISKSTIIIENNSIQSFCIELKHKTINALCNLTN